MKCQICTDYHFVSVTRLCYVANLSIKIISVKKSQLNGRQIHKELCILKLHIEKYLEEFQYTLWIGKNGKITHSAVC